MRISKIAVKEVNIYPLRSDNLSSSSGSLIY